MAFVTSFLGASLASGPTNALRAKTCERTAKAGAVTMEFSAAVPFLEKPAKLNGTLPGDVGFDPLGFSNMYDLNFLRESEGT